MSKITGVAYLAGITAVVAALASAPAVSSPAPVQKFTGIPALFRQKQLPILKKFPVTGGVTGWLIMAGPFRRIVYSLPDGDVFFGGLVGADGSDLDTLYLHRYAPIGDIDKLLAQTQGVKDGVEGRQMIVFMDPNCIYCHELWVNTRGAVRNGHLQLQWVPVAFLHSSSLGRAAAILMAKDPSAALRLNEVNFNVKEEEGGVKPREPTNAVKTQLTQNISVLSKLDGAGTPTIVYRTNSGKWAVENGLPTKEWLAKYAGLQPNSIEGYAH